MLTGSALIAAGLGILFSARAAHEVTREVNGWAIRDAYRRSPRVRSVMLRLEPALAMAGTVLGVVVGIAAVGYGLYLVADSLA